MSISLLLGALALVFSLCLTPVARNAFLRLGLVDEPDNDRKLHTKRIPRIGGIAVFMAYLGSFAVVATFGILRGSSPLPDVGGG